MIHYVLHKVWDCSLFKFMKAGERIPAKPVLLQHERSLSVLHDCSPAVNLTAPVPLTAGISSIRARRCGSMRDQIGRQSTRCTVSAVWRAWWEVCLASGGLSPPSCHQASSPPLHTDDWICDLQRSGQTWPDICHRNVKLHLIRCARASSQVTVYFFYLFSQLWHFPVIWQDNQSVKSVNH